mmetsp:Transcript_2636/g.7317  ORF Transcript_2636/g.7317 Transcript_2636/m.7317 type:complete len:204 (-) Transcript_2636:397-1008(-)
MARPEILRIARRPLSLLSRIWVAATRRGLIPTLINALSHRMCSMRKHKADNLHQSRSCSTDCLFAKGFGPQLPHHHRNLCIELAKRKIFHSFEVYSVKGRPSWTNPHPQHSRKFPKRSRCASSLVWMTHCLPCWWSAAEMAWAASSRSRTRWDRSWEKKMRCRRRWSSCAATTPTPSKRWTACNGAPTCALMSADSSTTWTSG